MSFQSFLTSVLPNGILGFIQKQAQTLARSGMTYFRHPKHQSGMVLPEDGSVDIKAGNGPLAASLTLNAHGTAQLCTPGSISIVGPVLLSGNPFDGLKFSYGDVGFNPDLQTYPLYTLTAEQAQMIILTTDPKKPVPIPLGLLMTPVALFTPTDSQLNALDTVRSLLHI